MKRSTKIIKGSTPHYPLTWSFQFNNLITNEMYLGQPFPIFQSFKLDFPCGHCKSCWALELQVSMCQCFTFYIYMLFSEIHNQNYMSPFLKISKIVQ